MVIIDTTVTYAPRTEVSGSMRVRFAILVHVVYSAAKYSDVICPAAQHLNVACVAAEHSNVAPVV